MMARSLSSSKSEAGYIDARPPITNSTNSLATHGRTIHSGQSVPSLPLSSASAFGCFADVPSDPAVTVYMNRTPDIYETDEALTLVNDVSVQEETERVGQTLLVSNLSRSSQPLQQSCSDAA